MAECGTAEDLQEDILIDFLAKKGGRVKNKELVERFKKLINAPEPQLKAKYRDVFKDIVNKIALVKQEDNGIHMMCKARKTQGEKYIVLRKKYQHLVQERSGCNKEEKMTLSSPVEESVEQLEKEEPSTRSGEEKLENSDAPKIEKSFQKETIQNIDINGILSSKASAVNPTAEKVNMCEWIVQELPTPTADTKSQAPSGRTSDSQENPSLCSSEAFKEKQGKELCTASEGDTAYPVQIEVKVEEPQEEEFDSVFKDDSEQNGFEDGSGSMGSPSVALDPLEKEWLKCAASGHLTALCDLLRQDSSLAMKKDFTSGFTALHWAAKHGKEKMALMLINAGVDINLRAHGYTPLHIAALHSHVNIMDLLIHNYGAKTNVRDYSGRFASHYLKENDDSTDCSNVSSQFQQSRGERRNRKLAGLFLPKSHGSSKKSWGSVENLTMEDKDGSIFLSVPTSYKAVRKFSR
ncbi:ankyrin repeat domain-containing protein SOWAHB-like isoform X2 [Carcharodon carcharias]|uniref:ankyrin repeat domain-containing protein SOWAHB-like isoform X2 n=1 Tax=Carcharodon carcharias TaxID=13397 RepID=UPI001B7ECD3F|nr:ankyrin repeat domain-containing protein SOWAHB-like isoform X2 [Carcharodon carcharias]